MHIPLARLKNSPSVRIAGYAASLAILLAGLWWSLSEIRFDWQSARWSLVAPTISVGLLTIWLGGIRFGQLAGTLDVSFDRKKCLNVVVNGGIANLLPLPGSLMVRWYVLSQHVGPKKSTIANIGITGLWVGATMLLAAAGFYQIGLERLFWIALVLSGSGLVVFFLLQVSISNQSLIASTPLVLTQLIITITYVVRLWLIGQFLGLDAPVAFYAVLTISALAGSASGIFPAGLGVVELFGAILAFLINFRPEEAFLVLALSRAVTILSLLLFWLALRYQPIRA